MTTHERIPVRISDQELARRWAALRAVMASREIDVVIVQATNDWLGGNVKWLTDIPARTGSIDQKKPEDQQRDRQQQ